MSIRFLFPEPWYMLIASLFNTFDEQSALPTLGNFSSLGKFQVVRENYAFLGNFEKFINLNMI